MGRRRDERSDGVGCRCSFSPFSTPTSRTNGNPLSRKFVIDNFLPVCFLAAIVLALAWPYPGQQLMRVKILGNIFVFQELAMILVFFIAGFTLKAGDALAALRRGRGVAWGFLAILGVTPLLGFALRAVPLVPEEFSTAMAIMAAVPTTLGIGVALVVSADGDDAVAVLLTVGTNLLGCVIIPPWLKAYGAAALRWGAPMALPGLADGGRVEVLSLFLRLLVTTLAPTVAGCTVRSLWPAARRFATRWKRQLSMAATLLLATIIWQSLSTARPALLRQPFASLVYVVLLSIAQHLVHYAINVFACLVLKLSPPEATAVAVMGSQKSAPVAVAVAASVAASGEQFGLMVVPMIINQLLQVFSSSAVAGTFRGRNGAWKAAEKERREAGKEGGRKGAEEEEVDRSRAEAPSTIGRAAV